VKRRATPCAWLAVFTFAISTPAHAARPLGWFSPAPAPAGWKHLALPAAHATVSYPPSLHSVTSDVASVSVARRDRNGNYLEYLNVTPQQGNERAASWPAFRIERLREESAIIIHESAQATGLAFRAGTGSCVVDDYVTRIKHHHFREIACFVTGRHSGSVLVAAAPVSAWAAVAGELERAVDTFAVR
jgi:hypothetical protein